jgi:hypothetical protein
MNNDIKYVPMPDGITKINLTVEGTENLNPTIRNIAQKMKKFYEYMSRGKLQITAKFGKIGSGGHLSETNKILRLIPGKHSSLPTIGNGISAKHELGHEFLLGHASTRVWGTQNKLVFYKHEQDPFDPMTVSPGVDSINAPHLHIKGWFSDTEEAYLEDGKEYTLFAMNNSKADRKTLKALYYEVPNSSRKYWFSCVLLGGKKPEVAIVIHTITPRGTSLAHLDTYLEQTYRISDSGVTNIRTGVILYLGNQTNNSLSVKVKIDPNWKLEEIITSGMNIPDEEDLEPDEEDELDVDVSEQVD